ncbi:MAG: preprotein translocase subunit YajC [Minicystis sp.]
MSTLAFQPTPAAPGREGPQAPAPTTGTAPAEGPPPGTQQPGGPSSSIMMLLMVVLPVLLFWTMSSGNRKRQKQLESSLKVGDTVLTQAGLVGKVTEMTETRVKLEIAPGVSVRMLKSAISGVDAGEQKPAESTKDKPQEKKA